MVINFTKIYSFEYYRSTWTISTGLIVYWYVDRSLPGETLNIDLYQMIRDDIGR